MHYFVAVLLSDQIFLVNRQDASGILPCQQNKIHRTAYVNPARVACSDWKAMDVRVIAV